MNRKTKVGFIALSVALLAVVALTGVTALLAGGSTGPASVSDTAGIRGNIEYTVYDSAGNVKYTRSIHNAVNQDPALNTAVDRLTEIALADVTDALTFSRIVAITAAGDGATDGFDAASVTLLLDGDTGAAGNQNPAQGTNPDSAALGTGKVQATFTATGAATIRQLGLVNTAVDDTTAGGGALAIATGELLAAQGVNIELALSDTLQVTWTVTVSTLDGI